MSSFDSTIAILTSLRDQLDGVIEREIEARELETDIFARGSSSTTAIESAINSVLSGLNTNITAIASSLTAAALQIELWFPSINQAMMFNPLSWKSISVDVDDGASGSTLTINQDVTTTIMTVFDVGDVVEITKAEDPNHNARHTVATVTTTVLTFDATMLGKDNANDETMIITLVGR